METGKMKKTHFLQEENQSNQINATTPILEKDRILNEHPHATVRKTPAIANTAGHHPHASHHWSKGQCVSTAGVFLLLFLFFFAIIRWRVKIGQEKKTRSRLSLDHHHDNDNESMPVQSAAPTTDVGRTVIVASSLDYNYENNAVTSSQVRYLPFSISDHEYNVTRNDTEEYSGGRCETNALMSPTISVRSTDSTEDDSALCNIILENDPSRQRASSNYDAADSISTSCNTLIDEYQDASSTMQPTAPPKTTSWMSFATVRQYIDNIKDNWLNAVFTIWKSSSDQTSQVDDRITGINRAIEGDNDESDSVLCFLDPTSNYSTGQSESSPVMGDGTDELEELGCSYETVFDRSLTPLVPQIITGNERSAQIADENGIAGNIREVSRADQNPHETVDIVSEENVSCSTPRNETTDIYIQTQSRSEDRPRNAPYMGTSFRAGGHSNTHFLPTTANLLTNNTNYNEHPPDPLVTQDDAPRNVIPCSNSTPQFPDNVIGLNNNLNATECNRQCTRHMRSSRVSPPTYQQSMRVRNHQPEISRPSSSTPQDIPILTSDILSSDDSSNLHSNSSFHTTRNRTETSRMATHSSSRHHRHNHRTSHIHYNRAQSDALSRPLQFQPIHTAVGNGLVMQQMPDGSRLVFIPPPKLPEYSESELPSQPPPAYQ